MYSPPGEGVPYKGLSVRDHVFQHDAEFWGPPDENLYRGAGGGMPTAARVVWRSNKSAGP